MNNTLINWTIKAVVFVIICAIAFLVMTCSDRFRQEYTEITRIDTVRVVEHTIEYVIGEPRYIELEVPVPIYIGDTTIIYRDNLIEVPHNLYTIGHRDSLIQIDVSAEVAGELLAWNIDYTPITKIINERETITIDRVTTRYPSEFYYGLGMMGIYGGRGSEEEPNLDLLIGPEVGYSTRTYNIFYSPKYSIDRNSVNHIFGVSIKF